MDHVRLNRWLIGLGMAVVAVGCSPGPVDVNRPRPPVTDRLREACTDRSDMDIEALIFEVELDRQAGVVKRKALELATQRCGQRGGEAQACLTCAATIVDEVYGL